MDGWRRGVRGIIGGRMVDTFDKRQDGLGEKGGGWLNMG